MDGNKWTETKSRGSAAHPAELTANKPLGFTLKDLTADHDYIRQRGIAAATAESFGLGFFRAKGRLSGRVVIPIHDALGQLVAYAGRTNDNAEPKYKLPTGFYKSLELFNYHRAVEAEAHGRPFARLMFACLDQSSGGAAARVRHAAGLKMLCISRERRRIHSRPKCWHHQWLIRTAPRRYYSLHCSVRDSEVGHRYCPLKFDIQTATASKAASTGRESVANVPVRDCPHRTHRVIHPSEVCCL